MHKIDGDGNLDGSFVPGNPTTGQPATQVTAEWLNAVQEEVANVISGAGMPLAKPNNSQLLEAIRKMFATSPGVAKAWGQVTAGSTPVIDNSHGLDMSRPGGPLVVSGEECRLYLAEPGLSPSNVVVVSPLGLRHGTSLLTVWQLFRGSDSIWVSFGDAGGSKGFANCTGSFSFVVYDAPAD